MKPACCGRHTRKILGRIARRLENTTRRRNRQVKISPATVKGVLVKQCPSCSGNLADFVEVCPYCGVAAPRSGARQTGWPYHPAQAQRSAPPENSGKALASLICGVFFF